MKSKYAKHIETTKKLFQGRGTWQDVEIPLGCANEVARGAAILDSYTNWALFNNIEPEEAAVIAMRVPNPDDGYHALDAYVYGAIQLAEGFGGTDFYNYYNDWVDNVIIPAIKEL